MTSLQLDSLYQKYVNGDTTVAKEIITSYANLVKKTSADATKYVLFKKVHLRGEFIARFTLDQFTRKTKIKIKTKKNKMKKVSS